MLMIYKEENRDLFTVPDDYYLAQCISADFAMGKGIAMEFNRRFDLKRKLKAKYPDFVDEWDYHDDLTTANGFCKLEGRVFNLITKRNYWQKPTYRTLRAALSQMHDIAVNNKISKIAMPVIGCGLDKLRWDIVSEMIKKEYVDTDVEILICKK